VHRIALVLAVTTLGCSSLYHEEPCGRQRSVTARGAVVGTYVSLGDSATASLVVIDEDARRLALFDGISWEIKAPGLRDSITAIHLHDLVPGHDGRMLYNIPVTNLVPGSDFESAGTLDYSYTTSIDNLFQTVRSGQTYLDVHTVAHPEGAIRADLTQVQLEDWSGYFCS
jgi:CHRD domain-containing protein